MATSRLEEIDTSRYRVPPDAAVKLGDYDPSERGPYAEGLQGKAEAKKDLRKLTPRLSDLQERLYADGGRSLLVVIQAIDAGGKDGSIRKVFSGVNPQGVKVTSFKKPSVEELEHDFLWRVHKAVPRLGMIGVFNRSHYEDVLVVRVKDLVPETVWRARYDHINAFEKLLADSGTEVLKFYLHISRAEQKRRFEKRLRNPEKHWKFNPGDLKERELWDDYQAAFEDALSKCSTKLAPWYVIPANFKGYRSVLMSKIIVETLAGMGLEYPGIDYRPQDISIPD